MRTTTTSTVTGASASGLFGKAGHTFLVRYPGRLIGCDLISTEGQRDLHATIDTHYIPPPPTIYTTLAGYGIAERDGERRESGRRACLRYGAERDLYAIRCGPGRRACLRIGTACVLRIGTTSDTVRARTASERSDGVRYAVRLRSARANGAVRNHVRA